MSRVLKQIMLIMMLPLTVLALLAGEACVFAATFELNFTLAGRLRYWLDIPAARDRIGSILSWTLPVWALLMIVLILRQLHQEHQRSRGSLTAPYLLRSRRIQRVGGMLLTAVTLLNAGLLNQLTEIGWPVFLPGAALLLRLIVELIHPLHGGTYHEQET